MKRDDNLEFLNKFVELYEELIDHDGYGDMSVKIRVVQGRNREVRLQCGREYRFVIHRSSSEQRPGRYKIVDTQAGTSPFGGRERRGGKSRRERYDRREKRDKPFQFRLERRLDGERRSSRGRRKDD